MEQYQNPIIIQNPEQQPASTSMQTAALALGISSFVLSFICYFVAIFGNVMRAATYQYEGSSAYGVIVIVMAVIGFLLGAAAIILGAVGLVRSIRRPRTVKGIVFSAVGLCFGIAGIVFAFISVFITEIFSVIIAASRF